MLSTGQLILRLGMATLLGGMIGFEREVNNRPAGFRTHILVTLGSCLVMILSMHAFVGFGVDGAGGEPARLAAQVVSGIGFLGAGTIMREGTNVRGLTTAASIWISGGIGLAVGSGFYLGAVVTTALALFSLASLQVVEKRMTRLKRYSVIRVQGIGRPGFIGSIGVILGKHYINIKNIVVEDHSTIYRDEYEDNLEIVFYVRTPGKFDQAKIYEELGRVEGVHCVYWDDVLVICNSKQNASL